MSTIPPRSRREHQPGKLLRQGDRLEQPEFHALYCQMDEDYRAELIGGIVHEPSPLGYQHGRSHIRIGYLLEHYAANTLGVEAADDATVILSNADEVQPDVHLRIMPAYGGRSRNVYIKEPADKGTCEYVAGPPELVAEVALSSLDVDLRLKKRRYALAGVLEYIVVCLKPQRLYWFDLPDDRELPAGSDVVYRSKVFPGLWIDVEALLQLDYRRSMDALTQGLQSPEYLQFAKKLVRGTDT